MLFHGHGQLERLSANSPIAVSLCKRSFEFINELRLSVFGVLHRATTRRRV